MQALTQLFTASKLYAHLSVQKKWKSELSWEENLEVAKSAFFLDFPPAKLQKFERLQHERPALFQEIMATAELDTLLSEAESDPNYTQNVQLVLRYQEWMALTQSYEERQHLEIPNVYKNVNFIEKFLEADFELDVVEYPSVGAEDVIGFVESNLERRGMMEIADDPMQNVLYQLAKQLYGYAGHDEQEALMQFFSEAEGGVFGVYYSNEWKVNDEWAIDQKMKRAVFAPYSQEQVPAMVEHFLQQLLDASSVIGFSRQKMIMLLAPFPLQAGLPLLKDQKSVIDTPTETIDRQLQQEWIQTLRTLLTQELMLRTKENQQKVKNQISYFVQQHSKD